MKTFGEFFDTVSDWAKREGNVDAQIFMEEWPALATPEKWQEARALEFAEDLFRNFAEDMATYIRERIAGIDGEELYDMTMDDGHSFLQTIADQGRIFGLVIETDEVDVPLSPSDAIARAAMGKKGE